MNIFNSMQNKKSLPDPLFNILVVAALLLFGIIALIVGQIIVQAETGTSLVQMVNGFFALDSIHVWWYISRASGLMAYLLVWLSTIWGFAISSKIFDSYIERVFTYDFHEHLSLLSLGFVLLHAIVLLLDHVEPMSLMEILIPFTSGYRPFWTGIGIIAFYLSILVTVTFYIRTWISMKTFRTIHYLSVAVYVGALLHGLYTGTDSALNWTQYMYWGTFLSSVFFCVYWLVIVRLRKRNDIDPKRRSLELLHKL
jgi:predicted ferric reductase